MNRMIMLGSDDGPGGDDLRDLRDGTRDWGKGRVYILYAITDANTIQAVVVHHIIHQSISTLMGYSLARARSSPPTRLCTRRHPHSSNRLGVQHKFLFTLRDIGDTQLLEFISLQ
jgi:hypothetical protein